MANGLLKRAFLSEMKKASNFFHATRDLKWIVRYAKVDMQRQETSKPTVSAPHLPTIEEFDLSLRSPSALRVRDKRQTTSNFVMASALSRYLEQHESSKPAFKALTGRGLQEVLDEEVFPTQPQDLEKLKLYFFDALAPLKLGDAEHEAIYNIGKTSKSFLDLLKYTLTLSYVQTLKNAIILNPLLVLIPPEQLLKKQAHLLIDAAIEINGTRLNQLIKALKLAQANMLQEYNIISMYSRNASSPSAKKLFGEKKRSEMDSAFLPRSFRTTAQYIEVYERLAKNLQIYMNPSDPQLKIERQNLLIPGTKVPVTSNPPISASGPAGLMSFLTPDHLFRHLKGFKVTNVLGEQTNLRRSISIKSSDLAKLYSAGDPSNDFADNLINNISKNTNEAKEFNEVSNASISIKALEGVLRPDSSITASGLYSELDLALQLIVEQYSASNSDLLVSAEQESRESYSPENKKANSANMAKYERGLLDAMADGMGSLVLKYNSYVSNASILREQIRSIISNKTIPISPFTARYLRSSDYSMPKTEAAKQITKEIKKYFDTHFISVVSDPKFRLSEDVIEEEQAEQLVGTKNDFTSYINEQTLLLSKSTDILEKLGISQSAISATMSEALAAPANRKQNLAKQKISEALDAPLSMSKEQLKQILGEIPLDALYVYLSHQFMFWSDEHQFNESIIKKAASAAPKSAEENIPSQVDVFINENFNITREGANRGSLLSKLSRSSIAGRIQEWHEKRDGLNDLAKERGRRPPNIWGHLFRKAHQSFSSETRAVAERTVIKIMDNNASDPRVTNDNWDDPAFPQPRSWAELAHISGAFADPLPGVNIQDNQGGTLDSMISLVADDRIPRRPGETITENKIKYIDGKPTMTGIDTPEKHIRRALTKIGYGVVPVGGGQIKVSNPISEIERLIQGRRQEIMEIPEWKEFQVELNGFDIDKSKSYKINSFVNDVNNSTGRTFSKKDAILYIRNLPDNVLGKAERKSLSNIVSKFSRESESFKSKDNFIADLPIYMSTMSIKIDEETQGAVFSTIDKLEDSGVNVANKPREESARPKLNPPIEYINSYFSKLSELIKTSESISAPIDAKGRQAISIFINEANIIQRDITALLSRIVLSEKEQHEFNRVISEAQKFVLKMQALIAPENTPMGVEGPYVQEIRAGAVALQKESMPRLALIKSRHGEFVAGDMSDLIELLTRPSDPKDLIHPSKVSFILEKLDQIGSTDPSLFKQDWLRYYDQIREGFLAQIVRRVDLEYGMEPEANLELNDKYYYL